MLFWYMKKSFFQAKMELEASNKQTYVYLPSYFVKQYY